MGREVNFVESKGLCQLHLAGELPPFSRSCTRPSTHDLNVASKRGYPDCFHWRVNLRNAASGASVSPTSTLTL